MIEKQNSRRIRDVLASLRQYRRAVAKGVAARSARPIRTDGRERIVIDTRMSIDLTDEERAVSPVPRARLVSAAFVRAYLGVDGATLSRMRKAGSVPAPIAGTRKYDFEAVKRALDQISHPESTIGSVEDELIARAKLWGKRHR